MFQIARLAQTVERMTLNHVVVGSIPTVGGYYQFCILFKCIKIKMSVDSSMVRIRAFQARGPGSIPGQRILYYFVIQNVWMGPWCNWLALWTLNPAIRVQIPVGPTF